MMVAEETRPLEEARITLARVVGELAEKVHEVQLLVDEMRREDTHRG